MSVDGTKATGRKDHYCMVLIAAGPHEALVGDYQTGPMERGLAIAAVSDLAKLGIGPQQLDHFGSDAKPVAARCYAYDRSSVVAYSPWISQLDWSPEPVHGQPKSSDRNALS